MTVNKKNKLFFLFGYLIFALLFVYVIKPLYLVSIIIVLAVPSFINFFWLKKSRLPVLFFSLASSLLFAPPVELMARLANVWDVQSIFYRPFGLIPIENMIFAFLNFFWGISFYKYFIENDGFTTISRNFKYLIALFTTFSGAVYTLYFFNPNLVKANYFTVALIILIIPGAILIINNPKLFKKTISTTIFFAILFFIYELVSLKIGSWFWPGNYFITLNILGQIMPLDDIIIWYFMSTPVLIYGYKYFIDDNNQFYEE